MKVPPGWYAILSSNELIASRPLAVERFGISLVAWRDSSGSVVLMSDLCPHRSVKLSLGTVSKDCIVCPFHGFEFDQTGACQLIPETKKSAVNLKVPTYSVAEKHGFIWMCLGADSPVDAIPWFSEIERENLAHSEFTATWPIHVTRCVENQLDYAHLPYLHKTTIGKNFDVTLKRQFELTEQRIKLSFDGEGSFEFKFPNIWLLEIRPGAFYQMMAFVPVNDRSTKLYIRAYQGFVTLGLLKPIVDKAMNFSNSIILNQDKYAVVSQFPNSSIDAVDEKLYPSDRGIAWYREKWSEREIEI